MANTSASWMTLRNPRRTSLLGENSSFVASKQSNAGLDRHDVDEQPDTDEDAQPALQWVRLVPPECDPHKKSEANNHPDVGSYDFPRCEGPRLLCRRQSSHFERHGATR